MGDRTNNTRLTRSPRATLAIACAAIALAAGGCDRASKNQAALADARRSMRALHSGQDAPSADVVRAVGADVVAKLKPVADKLTGAESASAWALLAQAQAALAQLDAAQAAGADSKLMDLAVQARSQANLCVAQQSLAAALEKEDPRAALTDLDQQGRTLDAELTKAKALREKESQRLSALEAAGAEQTKQAKAQHAEELAQRATAAEAAPAQRAGGYEAAHATSRKAAAFEKRAAEIESDARMVRPLIGIHDADVERIGRQRGLVDAAKKQIEQSVAGAREQGKKAHDDARTAADALGAKIEEINAALSGDSTAKHESAANGFTSAVTSQRNAVKNSGQGDSKTSPSVALAEYQQTLGDLRAGRAQTLGVLEALLRSVKAIQPPVGDAAALDASIAKLDEMRLKAAEAAAQAYDGARSTLASSGARGEAGEKIKALSGLLPGAPPPAPPEAQPNQPAPTPAPEGATPPPAPESPPPAQPTPAPPKA